MCQISISQVQRFQSCYFPDKPYCLAITDHVTLACIFSFALSCTTGVNLGIVKKQCVTLNSKVLKRF